MVVMQTLYIEFLCFCNSDDVTGTVIFVSLTVTNLLLLDPVGSYGTATKFSITLRLCHLK
jgi:hypothetical protein